MARPQPTVRIGETERTAAQLALQDHLNAGRLQIAEYADRSARASGAATAAELAELFADLPAPHPKLPGTPAGGTGRNLVILAVAAAVIVVAGVAAVVLLRPGPAAAPPSIPVAAPTNGPDALSTTSRPTSAAPTTTDSGPTAVLDGTTVRRTTGDDAITLQTSYGVDLDDDTSPNWNVGRECCDSDVEWTSRGDLVIDTDHAVVSGAATYATCAQTTAYTDQSIELGSLRPGENICVRTSERRFALVTMVSASAQDVQFRATVWDPPISS